MPSWQFGAILTDVVSGSLFIPNTLQWFQGVEHLSNEISDASDYLPRTKHRLLLFRMFELSFFNETVFFENMIMKTFNKYSKLA